MLDSQGPRLIVFFVRPGTGMERFNTLIECALQQYDFHDVSAEAQLHDVAYYFLRREAAYP